MQQLTSKAKSAVRELEPHNDLTFFRIRSKKNEIMVAPGMSSFESCLCCVEINFYLLHFLVVAVYVWFFDDALLHFDCLETKGKIATIIIQ